MHRKVRGGAALPWPWPWILICAIHSNKIQRVVVMGTAEWLRIAWRAQYTWGIHDPYTIYTGCITYTVYTTSVNASYPVYI